MPKIIDPKAHLMRRMKVDPETGCWVWQRGVDSNKRPRCKIGTEQYAHRNAFRLFKDTEIPEGMFVCHTCDNTLCINPDHLWLGTPKENTHDMIDKGRNTRGVLTHCSKLDPDKVRAIRARYAAGESQTAIAPDFGVSQVMVSLIVRRKKWAHVE